MNRGNPRTLDSLYQNMILMVILTRDYEDLKTKGCIRKAAVRLGRPIDYSEMVHYGQINRKFCKHVYQPILTYSRVLFSFFFFFFFCVNIKYLSFLLTG